MDRIALVSCVVFLLITIYFKEALATPHYDSSLSLDISKNKVYDGTNKISTAWLSPRLGRRKRNLKDDGYKVSDQELAEFLESFLEDSPFVSHNGNDKIICKNIQGKRNVNFIPRLGRNLDEGLSGRDRWLPDPDTDEYISQRSPPFAPRLGKRNLPYIPRLGREA